MALSFQTLLLNQYPINIFNLGFVFFATLFSYNLYWQLSKQSIFLFSKKESGTYISLALYFLLMIVCVIQSPLKFRVLYPAIILNGLYILPILPFKQLSFLKKFGFAKTFLLAFTWAYVTIVLPLNKPFLYLNNAKLLLFCNRFLFMLILCIIFDSRDILVDKIKGMHSLATDIKPKILKIITLICFALLLFTNYGLHQHGLYLPHNIALLIAIVALAILYYLSFKKRGYLFYYFFVDGMMLLSAILTYLASVLFN
ncbi:MAG: hypothetical protein KA319_08475 [Ferruginibacter sp.]|nr:hypothetical protein [Ferruginibacter sp.]